MRPYIERLLLMLLASVAIWLPPAARAQWRQDGVPVCTALMIQQNPASVPDGAGGAIVVWEDLRNYDVTRYDLYAQHVLASGVMDPAWPVNGLAVAVADSNQAFPSLVPDGSGGAFVAWEDTRDYSVNGYDVYAQHVLSTGTVDPAWPVNGRLMTGAQSQFRPKIVADGTGGAIVTWFGIRAADVSTGYDILAGHVLSNGTLDPAWPAGGLEVCIANFHQQDPVIASDGTGGALIAWHTQGGGIFAHHVLASGAVDPAWPVNGRQLCASILSQQSPQILATVDPPHAAVVFDNFDPGGTFHPQNNLAAAGVFRLSPGDPVEAVRAAVEFTVSGGSFTLNSITLPISLQSFGASNPNILRVRLTADAGGAPGATLEVLSLNQAIWPAFSNPFTTTSTLPSSLHPTLLNGTSYWIVTEPTAIPSESAYDVDYRWFDNTTGNLVNARQQTVAGGGLPGDPWPGSMFTAPQAFRVNGTTQPATAAIVVWEDDRGGAGNADIYAQRVTASGVDPVWPADGLALCTAAGQQQRPVAAPDGLGGMIAAWQDARAGGFDIYAQHALAGGVVDPTWPLNGRSLCIAANDQLFPATVPDGSGGAIVAWQDARGSNVDIYAQHVRPNGLVDPSWPADGLALCTNFYDQYVPTIVTDGAGGAIVAWQDGRGYPGGTRYDIYAQRAYADGAVAAVRPDGGPSRFRLLPLAPNPARGLELTVAFDLPTAQRVSVAVFDLTGRHVRTLANREFAAGRQHLGWDGRDEAGARLAGGVYFVRAQAGPASGEERVVLLR